MEGTLFVAWTISALIACWSVSMLVRWFAELGTRRRRSHRRMSTRHFVLTLLLSLLGFGIAFGSAWFGVYIHALWNDGAGISGGAYAAASITVCLFATGMYVWAFVGDRSHGRKRCPKCWYDMSGADLDRCPECGKPISDERQLYKARRPRWAFAAATLLLLPGVFTLYQSRRLTNGPLTLVPTWVLTMGWDQLPESWILHGRTSRGNPHPSLSTRLFDRWNGDGTAHRFGRSLCKPLLDDPVARADDRRWELIIACWSETTRKPGSSPNEEWYIAPPIDPEALLLVGFTDILDALENPNPTPAQTQLLSTSNMRSYSLAKSWIQSEQFSRDPDLASNYLRAQRALRTRTSPIMAPEADRLTDPKIYISSPSSRMRDWIIATLIEDAGIPDRAMPMLLDPAHIQSTRQYFFHARAIWSSANDDDPTKLRVVLESLRTSIARGSADERALALMYVSLLVRQYETLVNRVREEPECDVLLRAIVEHGLTDHRIAAGSYSSGMPIRTLALESLVPLDPDGLVVLIECRVLIEQTSSSLNLPEIEPNRRHTTRSDEYIRRWIETIGPLVSHPNPGVRAWLIENSPNPGRGVYPGFDAIAVSLLQDPVLLVQELAERLLSEYQ